MIVGFTNGCFDCFHAGHLKLLYEAKHLCDELHVGINSDFSVKNLKGIDRPIIPQDQRFEIVAAIKYVDRVYIFDDLTPIKLIKCIRPDIIIKGADYVSKEVVGSNIAPVHMVPLLPGISTSNIINKIRTI